MSNKEKYHPNSIGSRIAELMLQKLINNNDKPNQTNGTSNDQKSLQGKGKKK